MALSVEKRAGTRYDKTAPATDDRSVAGAVFIKIERASTMRATNKLARGGGKRLLLGGWFRSGDRHHFILQSGAANDEQDP